MRNHDIIEINIKPKRETENAVMVENIKGENVWLPKSQVEVDNEGIQMPEWLAEDKGLI